MTVDLRHPLAENYQGMLNTYREIVTSACQSLGLRFSNDCVWQAPGVEFDENCVEAVSKAVALTGYSNQRMFSGAGHDACNKSRTHLYPRIRKDEVQAKKQKPQDGIGQKL